jgi:hypothetical protein
MPARSRQATIENRFVVPPIKRAMSVFPRPSAFKSGKQLPNHFFLQ